MVVDSASPLDDAEVDRIFRALADATRRDIVTRVLQRPHSVSELAAGYAMSFAAVQKHVAVLEKAALVSKTKRGREQLVNGEVGAISRATELLRDFEELWRRRAGAIDALLAAEAAEAGTAGAGAPPAGTHA